MATTANWRRLLLQPMPFNDEESTLNSRFEMIMESDSEELDLESDDDLELETAFKMHLDLDTDSFSEQAIVDNESVCDDNDKNEQNISEFNLIGIDNAYSSKWCNLESIESNIYSINIQSTNRESIDSDSDNEYWFAAEYFDTNHPNAIQSQHDLSVVHYGVLV